MATGAVHAERGGGAAGVEGVGVGGVFLVEEGCEGAEGEGVEVGGVRGGAAEGAVGEGVGAVGDGDAVDVGEGPGGVGDAAAGAEHGDTGAVVAADAVQGCVGVADAWCVGMGSAEGGGSENTGAGLEAERARPEGGCGEDHGVGIVHHHSCQL